MSAEIFDFRKDLPIASVRLGPKDDLRVYAFTAEDLGVPMVEVRGGFDQHLYLTVEQAWAISAALATAAVRANGE